MSVFLRKQNTKNGISLSFVESFYDSKTKNSKQKTIKKLGYLSDLKKIYNDPIAHFTEEASKLSIESSVKYKENKQKKIPRVSPKRNIGHFIVKELYDRFNFKDVFTYLSLGKRYKFNLEDIFRFLIYSQIVSPSSKSKEFSLKDSYFDDFSFSDDQMYDAIKRIGEKDKVIKEFVQLQTKNIIKLDTSSTYFDGTNIYFEIDRESEELKRGPEKNGRHDPIIGLGLLMDSNGIPINYSLFPGNASEQPELHKNIQDLKKKDGIIGRTIVVADKGLNSGDNMYIATKNGDGYVIGQKVRGGNSDTISWVLQDDSNSPYETTYNDNNEIVYKIKSEIGEYPVQITSPLNGRKTYINLKQKRVVFWSKDFADKAKYEREKVVERARQIIANPSKYLKSTIGDAASFIKQLSYNSNGEIIPNNSILNLDTEAIEKAGALDGYYLIVTSETSLSNSEIIKIYRGLWEIEETFSIVKGVLKVRPLFAKTTEGIHAHILICFISLLLLRILQKNVLFKELSFEQIQAIQKANKRKKKHAIKFKKNFEYPITQICDFIRNFEALKIGDFYYVTQYHQMIPFLEERYNIVLDREALTESDINKIFSAHPQHTIKTLF